MKLNASDFLSVSQLNKFIYQSINDNNEFKDILLKAEVSNVRVSNGHVYLGLKDEHSKIDAIIWKSIVANINFQLQNGQSVFVKGSLQYYQVGGKLSLIIQKIQLAGIGQMLVQLQKLKGEYELKGFFDPQHKKPLPKYPERIGVITAENSAAFEDIKTTIQHRYPIVKIVLFPATVQGKNAPVAISKALEKANNYKPSLNVILLCRGGGSIEDLWCFNDPIVVDAIYKSKIPIVTGLGHAINLMISDLVADHHCVTPTGAAEAVTPNRVIIKKLLNKNANFIISNIQKQLKTFINQIAPLQKNIINLIQVKLKNQELKITDYYQQFNLKGHNLINYLQGIYQNQTTLLIKVMQDKVNAINTKSLILNHRLQSYPQYYYDQYHQKIIQVNQRLHYILRYLKDNILNINQNLLNSHKLCINFLYQQQTQLKEWKQNLNQIKQECIKIINLKIDDYNSKIKIISSQLKTFNPTLILKRGYVLVYDESKTHIIMNTKQIKPQTENINLKFNDGNIKAKLLSSTIKGATHDNK